jgi:integrase/recombinase XerD
MKVQRVRLPDQVAWMVLDDSYEPIQPILSYLKFLADLDRSPNTIRSHACHLKLFWEYLRDEHLSWIEIDGTVSISKGVGWSRKGGSGEHKKNLHVVR